MGFSEELKKYRRFGSNLNLNRIKNLLKKIGNPEKNLRIIHIAGTNGKGSTTLYLQSILFNMGFNVASFTSPYVYDFKERIKVNDKYVSQNELLKIYKETKNHIAKTNEEEEDHLTEFEILTAVTLKYFETLKLDFVILEVGLGGRLDSTNIKEDPLLTVITSISIDHTRELGETIKKIAREKAGIIKKNVPIIINVENNEAKKEIAKIAYKNKAPLLDVTTKKINIEFVLNSFFLPSYQEKNIRLVIAILSKLREVFLDTKVNGKELYFNQEKIIKGIKQTKLFGRFEIIKKNGTTFILDGSHNEDGIKNLKETIKKYYSDKKIVSIFSVLEDKNISKIVKTLEGFSDRIILTEAENDRVINKNKLKKYFNKKVETAENRKDAIKRAESDFSDKDNKDDKSTLSEKNEKHEKNTKKNKIDKNIKGDKNTKEKEKIILITGSFYLLKPMKDLIMGAK